MSRGRLGEALLLLALAAAVVGLVELALLASGRRRTLPGYGWETELTHVLMNLGMAAMLTSLWTAALARGAAAALAASTLLLATMPFLRPAPPRGDRLVAAFATVLHVFVALLMAWLFLRMAPVAAGGMAMPMPRSPGARSWIEWSCAGFFLFDLASVLASAAFLDRLPRRLRSGAPRVSILPHIAMDVGMVAMLLAL